jgi:small-conductance mechanosensitive channel
MEQSEIEKMNLLAPAAFEYKFAGPIEAVLTTLALPLVGLVLAYYVWSDVYWVDIASLLASLGETTNS